MRLLAQKSTSKPSLSVDDLMITDARNASLSRMRKLVVLKTDSSPPFKIPTEMSRKSAMGGNFSRDGNSLVAGWSGGMVVVADLREIHGQLDRFGVA